MISSSILKNQAIQKAIEGEWGKAIEINQQILKEEPHDIETLNRLAFAQAISGRAKAAKITYQKVLNLDSQNPIALKNMKKLKVGSLDSNHAMPRHSESMFLEESGKTKIIDLINTADIKITSKLTTGEVLNLRVKRLKIFVLDSRNSYLGMLPDDIGKRLIKFISGGNTYDAYVRTSDKNRLAVFVRETKRSTKFRNLPSFSLGEKTKVTFPSKSYKAELEDSEDESEEE